jgi:hypothetical protein
LRCCGNGVVEQQAAWAFAQLFGRLRCIGNTPALGIGGTEPGLNPSAAEIAVGGNEERP